MTLDEWALRFIEAVAWPAAFVAGLVIVMSGLMEITEDVIEMKEFDDAPRE